MHLHKKMCTQNARLVSIHLELIFRQTFLVRKKSKKKREINRKSFIFLLFIIFGNRLGEAVQGMSHGIAN